MVMKMNKSRFIQELKDRTNLPEEKCILVNNIIEDSFLIGQKNKEKIVNDMIQKLNITNVEAENIYEMAMNIILEEMKYKIKHPFKSKD